MLEITDNVIKEKAIIALAAVQDATIPLQYKFLLIRQCVIAIPTFWMRTVPVFFHLSRNWYQVVKESISSLFDFNIETDSFAEQVLQLPVRFGGFGIRDPSFQSHAAFAASLLSSAKCAESRLQPFPCSESSAERFELLLEEIITAGLLGNDISDPRRWLEKIQSTQEFPSLQDSPLAGGQKRLQSIFDNRIKGRIINHTDEKDLPHLQDTVSHGTSCWLQVIPSQPMLRVPDPLFTLLAQHKLGYSHTKALGGCPMCNTRPVSPSHAFTCTSMQQLRISRHDHLVRHLQMLLKKHVEVSKEQWITQRLRADLWLPGTSEAIDCTITSNGGLAHPEKDLDTAMNHAKKRKIDKYSSALSHGDLARFSPFVLSTMGAIHKSAKAFLERFIKDKNRRRMKTLALGTTVAIGSALIIQAHQRSLDIRSTRLLSHNSPQEGQVS